MQFGISFLYSVGNIEYNSSCESQENGQAIGRETVMNTQDRRQEAGIGGETTIENEERFICTDLAIVQMTPGSPMDHQRIPTDDILLGNFQYFLPGYSSEN